MWHLLSMFELYQTQVGDSLVLTEEGRKPRIVTATKVTQQSSNCCGSIWIGERKFSKDGVEKYDGGGLISVPAREDHAFFAESDGK